ncbi:MAG: hypothetical protein J3Q66DRAFT_438074 [Benniella sp.]|nr:MAG: hypothetical protein J3Q66DRAFT_438074 [Benniella sp.]
MTNKSTDQLVQQFQCRSTTEPIYIPAIVDARTDQYFVLWSDIQDVVEDAKSVKNGKLTVPFMKDDGLKKIEPLRIAYHPGVVLEIVEKTNHRSEAAEKGPSFMDDTTRESTGHDNDKPTEPPNEATDATPSFHTAVSLSIPNTNNDPTLVKPLMEKPRETQLVPCAYNHPHNAYESIMLGQEMQAASIKESMGVHFNHLQADMSKSNELQAQVLTMQQQMEQTTKELLEKQQEMQEMQAKMNEKQDRALQMQEQALDRLAVIQHRVQALLVQTYELHEYPIPRLFIVLPKVVQRRDRLMKPFAQQFRLYFLCECGTHTMPNDDSKTTHDIHLAKHDGYDLDKPTEFFDKYGTYILAMMYMIKYGIVAAGLAVPPLASLKVVDGFVEGQKHVDDLRKNIAPLVDDTIKYLQAVKGNTADDDTLTVEHAEFNKLEALEGADLRQLQYYLKFKDQGRVLGNLYRITTLEGHVKWVCFDHYRANYHESAIQKLQEVVELNKGRYIEEIGRIEIKVETNMQAKQFYDALINARGIQELEITLGWDATLDELRTFAKAITTANVIRLTVDGTHLQRPTRDLVNRSRRFNPILQLASNARIQSLHLKGFDDFFNRVSNPTLTPSHKFREFSMSSNDSRDRIIKAFDSFLDYCPSMTTVELKFYDEHPITRTMDVILDKLQKLESLKIDHGEVSFTSKLSGRRICDMTMTTNRLSDIRPDDFRVIQQGELTQVAIKYTPSEVDEVQLVKIIGCSRRLSVLRIGCQESRCLAITSLIVSERAKLLKRGSCQLRTFELMEEELLPFGERHPFTDKTHIHSSLSFTEGSPDFEMRTWIRLCKKALIKKDDPVCDFVREFGWSIVQFRGPYTFSDPLAEVLGDITNKRGSQFEKLVVNPISLTESGLDHVVKIVEGSSSSAALEFLLGGMEKSGRIEKSQALLGHYGRTLSRLSLSGMILESWLPEIALSFPTRDCFPKLTGLVVSQYSKGPFPSDCLPWILAMITTSSRTLEVTSPSPTSSGDVVVSPGSTCSDSEAGGLVSVELEGIVFEDEEWEEVLKAFDFSSLQVLALVNSNFTEKQFQLLIDLIPDDETEMTRLKVLDIRQTDIVKTADPQPLKELLGKLQEKVSSIEILK